MPVADLLKMANVIDRNVGGDDRVVAIDYVKRRVRALIAADGSLADPGKPGDIKVAATPLVATKLVAEMPKVKTAFREIWRRVGVDVAQKKHLAIDPATLRKHVSGRAPAGDARIMRRRLVLSIVHQAAARDPALADPANVERLHRLCDRRLRIVERMLYDVGRVERSARRWTRAQISGHAGGPWTDGFDRAFEYPRVPREFFDKACAAADDKCAAPMTGWALAGDIIITVPRTNRATTAQWRPDPSDAYRLDYTPAVAGSPKAVDAVNGLFATSADYGARNLLYCDHTIHALHLEALVFAESKRGTPGNTNWLDGVVKSKPPGWLRLHHALGTAGVDNPDPGLYLGGRGEPAFFEHISVGFQDLEVGDHLIVYNHPAYDRATLHGAWTLENAVVVQTVPELLVQGHGTSQLSMADARRVMLDYFRTALDGCRADVGRLAAVRSSAVNTVTVDTVARLRRGMRIQIVDAVTEELIATDLLITDINARARVVAYDGSSRKATSKHVVRRKRVLQFDGKFEGIELDSATSGRTMTLLRRVPAASSTFAPGTNQLADWHVAWVATKAEDAMRKNAAHAKFVKDNQRVDFTVETLGSKDVTVGWFPLWEASTPIVRKNGKIARIQPVRVQPDQIAAWNWFVDPDAGKRLVPVIRPKVG